MMFHGLRRKDFALDHGIQNAIFVCNFGNFDANNLYKFLLKGKDKKQKTYFLERH
jgi:hypothetical protein